MQKAKKIAPPTDMEQHNADMKKAAEAPKEKAMTETAEKLSTREAADELGTTPRELRKFLRSANMGVGQGKRYELTVKSVPSLKKKFDAWKQVDEAKAQKVEADPNADEAEAAVAETDLEELTEVIDEEPVEEPADDGLDKMTVSALQDEAKAAELTGFSKLKKAELIAAIRDARELLKG